MHSLLRPGDGAVDVGANLGLYAARLGAAGVIVSAFEPNARARRVLERNLAQNAPPGNWRIYDVALDENDGVAQMSNDLESSNYLVGNGYSGSAVEVQMRRLDSVVIDNPLWFSSHNVVLLKIDAEGRDAHVLRGAEQLISRHRPVILVESWSGDDVASVLDRYHYSVYEFDLASRKLVAMSLASERQANIIAVPLDRTDLVESRLSEICKPLASAKVSWKPNSPL